MNETEGENQHVRAVVTSFRILEVLRESGGGVSAIASELDLAKSTVHNHLQTLEQLGYVVADDGEYTLGLRLLDLGYHARRPYRLYEAAKPEADDIAERTGDRCQVMVREGTEGVYVYQTSGEQAITTDSHIGTRVDLHATAVGKAYLAYLPESDLEEILTSSPLEKITEKTTTDREDLLEELEEIREQGVAFNDEERILGMRAVGAPILAQDGTVLGGLSVSGPTTRFQGDRYQTEIPDIVRRSARVIGIKATYV
ncbi:IclR family transcriptional regulator [Natronosalvus amylolyticus]|uniref:IclR family transcriptional regulator n=1 Tax=Natronosalvus amylolyticus TaxID=2961994 RepID=UPI0020C960D6|nr:IclR family transcriptional regulator [Natronosalvus amylolyticus]